MKDKKKIALTGGASGGHIFPLVSVYNYFQEEGGYDFMWVGEEDSLEEDIAGKNKIPFFSIAAGKIRRYFDLRNFYEPLKNLTGICEGIYYILSQKIDIVFSKGGYVSLPLCIAAWILRKDIYIHESDVKTGLSNNIISKVATKVFCSFESEKTKAEGKYIYTGQMLNSELIDYLDNLQVTENDRLQVLVIAGSQGSQTIFDNLLKILPDLTDIDFQIILGEKNMHYRNDFKKFSNTLVHDFVTQKRLGKILKDVDIAITRAGATSLFELTTFGVHSIIVPITNAGGHQIYNAQYFHNKFGSDILNENENLNLEMFRLLQKYKSLRKAGLMLDTFFAPMKKIYSEVNK